MVDRDYLLSQEELPLRFDFKFRPWRYKLSLSELELRSFDRGAAPVFVSIRFHAVIAMQLKTVFTSLTLANADTSQSAELRRIADIDDSRWSRVRCFALSSTGVDSLVACTGYAVRIYPTGFPADGRGNFGR
ncbi:hypothetical protein [Nocardia sp. NPDC023988]|uniref:hypothetical protein n=1 Tax=unclassified Nocardia TaxID=2637762 RepID=UPI0033F3CBB9